jgi:hypothetical protein
MKSGRHLVCRRIDPATGEARSEPARLGDPVPAAWIHQAGGPFHLADLPQIGLCFVRQERDEATGERFSHVVWPAEAGAALYVHERVPGRTAVIARVAKEIEELNAVLGRPGTSGNAGSPRAR